MVDGQKNNQGRIKLRNVAPKVITQYSAPTDPRCGVKLYKTYVDCLPQNEQFYKRPIKALKNATPRFS